MGFVLVGGFDILDPELDVGRDCVDRPLRGGFAFDRIDLAKSMRFSTSELCDRPSCASPALFVIKVSEG